MTKSVSQLVVKKKKKTLLECENKQFIVWLETEICSLVWLVLLVRVKNITVSLHIL